MALLPRLPSEALSLPRVKATPPPIPGVEDFASTPPNTVDLASLSAQLAQTRS